MNAKKLTVGTLALQGAFAKHGEMLQRIGAHPVYVRKPQELEACDALIIPGGESTTMFRRIDFIALAEPLRRFAEKKPLFGTCAGLILMAGEIAGENMKPFKLVDVAVERNAFGRQADSFCTDIELSLKREGKVAVPALFIRAPRIRRVGPDVTVLAIYEGEPVLIEQGLHLGATFHPELTENPTIHQYFLESVRAKR